MTPQQLREKVQQYLDESNVESDQYLEGLDVTLPAAIELFDDFLLFMAGGVQGVVKPLEGHGSLD